MKIRWQVVACLLLMYLSFGLFYQFGDFGIRGSTLSCIFLGLWIHGILRFSSDLLGLDWSLVYQRREFITVIGGAWWTALAHYYSFPSAKSFEVPVAFYSTFFAGIFSLPFLVNDLIVKRLRILRSRNLMVSASTVKRAKVARWLGDR